jgi:hypothetical protein
MQTTKKDEEKALIDSFEMYGKVIIASKQFESQLQDHLYQVFEDKLKDDLEGAGLECGKKKLPKIEEDKAKDMERYIHILMPIERFKDEEIHEEEEFYWGLGLAYSIEPEEEKETLPYAYISVYYKQKRWKDYFKTAKLVNRKYKIKPFADYTYLFPKNLDEYRRSKLEDIDSDLIDLTKEFMEIIRK